MIKNISKIVMIICTILIIVIISMLKTKENMDANVNEFETVLATTEVLNMDENGKREDDIHDEIKKYPVVDGSTSLIPLIAKIRSEYTGENLKEIQNKIYVSKTDNSYLNLIDDGCDIVIACEPTKETYESVKNEIIMTPIGYDALVFLVNNDFSIHSLTKMQIKDIYQGKIRNWKELGGDDIDILPFQRNKDSGSHVLLDKFIIKGEEMLPPIKDGYYEGMAGLVTGIAEYNNDNNAIGYSMFYFAKKMMKIDNMGIKLLNIEGIEPNDKTIRNKTYPCVNEFYVAIKKNEPENSMARKLYNFIISEEGKQIIENCGYISTK